MKFVLPLLVTHLLVSAVAGFVPIRRCAGSPQPRTKPLLSSSGGVYTRVRLGSAALALSSNDSFDISKPVFDLYAWRSVRGDALAKYNSLNQSEPLRINLSALFALTCFASPSLAEEINAEALSLPQTALTVVLGLACSAAFVRENQRRAKQLTRLEKELAALSLTIRLPTSILADAAFAKPVSIQQLQRKSASRVIAVTGTAAELAPTLQELRVLGRRLTQANTYVVVIPTDGSTRADWGLPNERFTWLAEPAVVLQWKTYFATLSEGSDFKWFGLSSSGRSFGSGQGSRPVSWIQMLGQHLRPTDILDENDVSKEDVDNVLSQMDLFYDALVQGNLEQMRSVCAEEQCKEVTGVIQAGGRLDDWKSCLQEGNRPAGMRVSGADVTIISKELAFSTVIEFPSAIEGATLLAMQKWIRQAGEWRLARHQTIPWAENAAAGTLICDCRGCVSLTRSANRRTFGGLIG